MGNVVTTCIAPDDIMNVTCCFYSLSGQALNDRPEQPHTLQRKGHILLAANGYPVLAC